MKKVEIESLIKSFLLFFISQGILVGALFFIDYKKELQVLDETIFSKMRVCSFNLECNEFKIDFVPLNKYELYKLYKDNDSLSSYFSIPNSTKNSLKIYLEKDKYLEKLNVLKKDLFLDFLLVLFVISVLSLFFAIYTLSPLRNALHMMEEFIKDILHDFNTPLSTLRLNVSMLKSEIGENSKIKRIENSVQNILNLQSNLRSYLHSQSSQKEKFKLKSFIDERIDLIGSSFKNIKFNINIPDVELNTNKDSFTRIIDNILSNAARYNKKDGEIYIIYENRCLIIQDTGNGIKNPKRVFERFYKEQDRGIGIGLHIVKKLCDELDVDISLDSEVNVGTKVSLNIVNII